MNTLANLKTRYEERAAKLGQLIEIIGSDEAFAQEVVEALIRTASHGAPAATEGSSGGQFGQVREFFRKNGNAWTSKGEISTGTKISDGSLAPLMYRCLKDGIVEQRAHPENPRWRQWRMKTAPEAMGPQQNNEDKL
jgi:hypothetical protein